MYDVAIIGAGPSGIFCGLELAKTAGLNVVMIDEGTSFWKKRCSFIDNGRCAKCSSCSTLAGFGGSAFFNPGKLSLYPAGSGLKHLLGGEECCKALYARVIAIMEKFGLNVSNEYQISEIPNLPYDNSIKVKYYNSYPVSKGKMNAFISEVQKILENNIELMMECHVNSIEKDKQWKLLLKNGDVIYAKYIAIGTGEYGYQWWKTIADKFGVKRICSNLDIGIRIEFSSKALEKYWPYHKDLKIIMRAPDNSEIRTYCVIKNGITVPCFYGDYTVWDGIADNNSDTAGMTIFNRVSESELGNDKVSYANKYLTNFYSKTSLPQSCSLSQFMNTDIWKQFVFEKHIYENLKFGIKKIFGYLEIDMTCISKIYVPVIDNLWQKCDVNNTFETTVKDMFVMGDATGIARGIMQSALSGIVVADSIKRGVKTNV